jgi:CheY-like chemotaxis protein
MTKILLVEDDKSLREIYGVRLLAEGYDIVSAGDGEEALAMAIKERPNLIVSDVMMPKISGFDMLDILRSTTETRGIKVIMMTALSSEDQRKRGEQLGADRYLVKSQVGIEDVVKTVHDVLGDGHLTPEQRTADKSAPKAPEDVAPATQAPTTPIQIQTQPLQPAQSTSATPSPAVNTAAPTTSRDINSVNLQPSRELPSFSREERPITRPNPQPADLAMQASIQQAQQQAATQSFVATPRPMAQAVNPVQQQAAPQASTMPQPTAPFSTDRPLGLGERVIQPPVQTSEAEAYEAQFAAELESVLGPQPQTNVAVDIPVQTAHQAVTPTPIPAQPSYQPQPVQVAAPDQMQNSEQPNQPHFGAQ